MEGKMSVNELLNELEAIINESQHVPFTQLVILEERQVFDIIDRIRAMPVPRSTPRQDTSSMTNSMREQGMMTATDLERVRIIEEAHQEADDIRRGADDYAREVLEELQGRLDRLMLSVQNGLKELERMQRDHTSAEQ
jgi:cell division septum initiation protein DivIVA